MWLALKEVVRRGESGSDQPDVFRLWLPGCPVCDVKLYFVAFLQAFVTLGLNRAEMNEHICTAFTCEESKPFCIVEPRHFTCILSHFIAPFRLQIFRSRSTMVALGWNTCVMQTCSARELQSVVCKTFFVKFSRNRDNWQMLLRSGRRRRRQRAQPVVHEV